MHWTFRANYQNSAALFQHSAANDNQSTWWRIIENNDHILNITLKKYLRTPLLHYLGFKNLNLVDRNVVPRSIKNVFHINHVLTAPITSNFYKIPIPIHFYICICACIFVFKYPSLTVWAVKTLHAFIIYSFPLYFSILVCVINRVWEAVNKKKCVGVIEHWSKQKNSEGKEKHNQRMKDSENMPLQM